MTDIKTIMSWLDGLAEPDWRIFHSDSEVQNIAKETLALLKEQTKTKVVFGRTKDGEFVTECGNCGTYLDKAYSNCPKCNKELDWNSNQT